MINVVERAMARWGGAIRSSGLCALLICCPLSAAAGQVTINSVVKVHNKGNVSGLSFLSQSLDNAPSIKTFPPGVTVRVYHHQLFGDILLGELTTDSAGRIQGTIDNGDFTSFDLVFEVPLVTSLVLATPQGSASTIIYNTDVIPGISGTYSNDITIPQTASDLEVGGANVLKEVYVMDKWLHDRIPAYVSRVQLDAEIDPDTMATGFEFNNFLGFFGVDGELRFGKPLMFMREAIYHEYAHAVMFSIYGNHLPTSSFAQPHTFITISEPIFAWLEGWSNFMMDAVASNLQFIGNPGTTMTLEANTFWKGSFDPAASGLSHSGESVEGAVASVLWDIADPADDDGISSDFATLWAAVSQARPSNFKEFWDAYMARSPTVKKEAFRKISETHGIVYSRAKVSGVDKKLDGNFSTPTSSDSIGKKAKVRIQPFLASELNLGATPENTSGARLLILNEALPGGDSDAFIDARLQDLSNWTIVSEDATPLDGLELLIDTELLGLQDGFYAFLAQIKDENGTYDTFLPDQRSLQSTAASLRARATLVNFSIDATPPTLWVIDGAGKVLNDTDDTQNGWVNISATPPPSNAPMKSLSVFLDTDYASPVAQAGPGGASLGFTLEENVWYWAQACSVADNCSQSSFVMVPPGGEKPPGPGAGPGGSRPPPHPPSTPQPPCLVSGVASCTLPPNVPGGPGAGAPADWPPSIFYPPTQFLVPGDPNHLYGPEGSVTPGQLMTYTLEFENVGDGTALGVFIKDVLDPNLDDSILTVRDMNTHVFVDDVPISTTPANFPWSYDLKTRTVTVLTGNAGPHHGGSFVIETRLKSTSPPGTVVSNQALVYFPNALQTITPTNTVISAVPLETRFSYVGVSSVAFLDTAALAARLTTDNGPALRQPVSFQLAGLTQNARTGSTGMAAASIFLSSAAGNYNLTMNYAGDNFFYLPSSANTPFTLTTRATHLQAPFASARPTDTVHLVLTLTDEQAQTLQRQTQEPKTVVLETLDASGTAIPLASSLLAGATVAFQFALPQPLKLRWPLRARFDGDSRYAAALSTGSLDLIDDVAPAIAITSPNGGETFSGAASIGVSFTVHDNADLAPGATAYFISLDGGQSIAAANGTSIPASSLSQGSWKLVVRASDWAGNSSALETQAFQVSLDVLAPRTSLIAETPSYGNDPLYVSSQTNVSLSATDDQTTVGDGLGVGVAQTFVSIDNGSSIPLVSSIVLTGEGPHSVTFHSVDLIGNAEAPQTRNLILDSTPPVTKLLVDNVISSSATLVVSMTTEFSFLKSDSGSGVAQTLYALDGSTATTVAVSTFSLSIGTHSLVFQSIDNVGNAEPAKTVSIAVAAPPVDHVPPSLALSPVDGSTVTTAVPTLLATYADLGVGIATTSVRLSLDGADKTSLAAISASEAAFTPAAPLDQGAHTLTASVSDAAGNTSTASAVFFIDSLPPVTTLQVNGLGVSATSLVLVSTDSLGFAASDAGTGALETRFSIDGATETVFVSTFSLGAGAHSLVFFSVDRALNREDPRRFEISVAGPSSDHVPPLVRLDFPASSALGVERAVGGVVNVRGAVSDDSAVSWTLESAPGATATSGFTTIASGSGQRTGQIAAWNTSALSGHRTLRLRAVDAFGNAAATTAGVYVGRPVMSFAIGRRNANAIVKRLKNPTGIAVRPDGRIWVAVDDALLLLTPAGGVAATVEGHGRRLKKPQGLALDGAGNVYVADIGNDRIVVFSPDGAQVLRELKGLCSPRDVAVDLIGDVYAADSGKHRVQVYDSSGTFLRRFGTGVLSSHDDIRGIALAPEGLWVSDHERQRLFLFSRAGTLIRSIGGADSAIGELSRMRGVAADRLGSVYTVETNRNRVQKFDAQGKGLLAFGSSAGLSRADKLAVR
ncbi:MAG: Ig-like domain-containing protein [Elusimicrobiota bacterium]